MTPVTQMGIFARSMTGKNFAVLADAFGIWFFTAGSIALGLSVLAAGVTSDLATAFRVLSLGLLVAGASTIIGWLLGLLFGIPRTLARPQPAGSAEGDKALGPQKSASTSRVNTNLEDISDWLTKTLIGVGLTQLYLLPHKIWSFAELINTSGFGWNPHGVLLGVGLLLYFMPGGFWLGYVATRTVLTKLFDSVEEATEVAEVVLAKDQIKLSVEGRAILPAADPEVVRADRALLRLPMHAMNTARQLAAWGVAKARAGQVALGVVALEEARDADPSDLSIRDALLSLYTIQRRAPEAESLLEGAPDINLAVLWALYENTPAGFRRAIEIGERLVRKPENKGDINLRVWLACAYGQEHAQALRDGQADLAEMSRAKVLENVEAAVDLDSRVKPWIISLWHAAPGSPDNDLSSLPADDPDMTRIVANG